MNKSNFIMQTFASEIKTQLSEKNAKLRARLEENEIELQQNKGEISVLKRQVREKSLEARQRLREIVALKSQNRDLLARLKQYSLKSGNTKECVSCRSSQNVSSNQTRTSKKSNCAEFVKEDALDFFHTDLNALTTLSRNDLLYRLEVAKQRFFDQRQKFESAQLQWAVEKATVLKYQERLQSCYVQIHQQAKILEQKVRFLTERLEVEAHELNERHNSLIYGANEKLDIQFSLEV